MPHSDELQALEGIVARASDLALQWAAKRSALVIDEKSAGQFASNADLDIEEQIRGALADRFAGDQIIGEEFGGSLGEEVTGWAIDPIDGTSNFILGLPLWGISVGYLENGRSTRGAIALPGLDLTLSAEAGGGLRVNGEGFTPSRPPAAVKIITLGENDFESGAETDARAERLRQENFSVVRYRCAVASLGLSALGRLSGYVEHGCGLWDIAAADVICREAGMTVTSRKIAEGRYAIDARW